MINGKYLLIDADVIVYRCCWAAHPRRKNEEEVDLGFDHVREFIDVTLDSITGLSPESPGELILSSSDSFRKALSTTKPYKGNREGQPKPLYFQEAKDYLVERYGAKYSTEGREADDELGIRLARDPQGSVVVSIDKDLLQISGWHHNWVRNQSQWVSRKAGDFKLYTQLLTGDTTDNIPGLYGVGPAGASELHEGAQSSSDLCQRAWNAYKASGHSDPRGYFLEQANLVYIHRRENDSFQAPIELQ